MSTKFTIPLIIGSGLCVFILTFLKTDLFFLMWILSVAGVVILQFLTRIQNKLEKKGEDVAKKIMHKYPHIFPNVNEQTEITPAQNFFLEACCFIFIGEYIALIIALLPFLIAAFTYNTLPGHQSLEKVEVILLTLITFLWILALERFFHLRLCTPYVKIPLKWVIIPFGVILLIN